MKKFGSAVILAGGLSRRMGFDKQFLEIGDTVLSRYLASALFAEFDEVIIVTNRPDCYDDPCLRIISDIIPGRGPLSGIHAGLSTASSDYVYLLACDMPNLSFEYIRYLKSRLSDGTHDACVTRSGEWIEPFHAFYSREMIRHIEDYLNQDRRSVFPLLRTLNTLYIGEEEALPFNPEGRLFANLNTRQEVESFLSTLPDGMLPYPASPGQGGREIIAACG
jgi:molybdopterin-guanine dinucleotide biosynthesis protein A